MKCCLYAVDGGPKETLRALAPRKDFDWVKSDAPSSFFDWQSYFESEAIDAVAVGTSRSEHGAASESRFRIAAKHAGLPIIAIEDYPGNWAGTV